MARAKKCEVTNVTLEYRSNYPGADDIAALSCEFGGARYHVWIDVNTRAIDGTITDRSKATLYKNPPLGVKHGSPEDFRTRQLNASSAHSTAIIDAMFAAMDRDGLKAKADQARADEIAAKEREHQERVAAAMIDEAAPQLFAACQVVALTPHIRAYLEANDPKALEQLTKAIAAAEGGAA
jgi:hypothetical protein